jgi:hypothetical protein
MPIIHGGLTEAQSVILEALGVIALYFLVKTLHKTHAFTPVCIAVLLVGTVWFAAHNIPFVGSVVCDFVKTAASAGGGTAPTC